MFTRETALDIAVQAQYLLNGYTESARTLGPSTLQELVGHISVTQRLAELAVIVHEVLQLPPLHDPVEIVEYPGMFEYEITEAMGSWFRTHCHCTDDQFREHLNAMVKEWMQ